MNDDNGIIVVKVLELSMRTESSDCHVYYKCGCLMNETFVKYKWIDSSTSLEYYVIYHTILAE